MRKYVKILLSLMFVILPFSFVSAEGDNNSFEENINNDIWILNKNGVKYYSDTSTSSDAELGIIPYNSVIKSSIRKYVQNNIWLYVNYGNGSGWILLATDMVSTEMAVEYEEDFTTALGTKLYDSPKDGANIVGTIPKNTNVKSSYVHGASMQWFYTEYNGTKGWIKGRDSFLKIETKKIVLLNDTYVYDEPDGTKTNTKVSKDKVLTVTTIKETYIGNGRLIYGLYNLDGKSVWILISGDNVDYAEQINSDILENETATIVSGDKIYSSANSNANEVGVIDENTKITEAYKYKDSKGNDSYYIVSSSGSGWVLKAFYDYKENANKNDKPNTDNNKITDGNNAFIWIVCSIICVLVIIAIIFVVKKNKKEIQNKD